MRLSNWVALAGYGGILTCFQPYFLAAAVHSASKTGPSGLLSTQVATMLLVFALRPRSVMTLKLSSPSSTPETKKS